MRRDYFTLDVRNVDWVDDDDEPRRPTVVIDFEGPSSTLRDRFTDADGELLDAAETDVALRLQGDLDDPDTAGVVAVTNRITGDFILELNETAENVLKFIRAARTYGKTTDDEAGYHVRVEMNGDEFLAYDKNTFLVYNEQGNLLRHHSLIPSGVEL